MNSKYTNFNEYYANQGSFEYQTKNIPNVIKCSELLLNDITDKKSKWLLTKVTNHINRTGSESSVTDYLQKISSDREFASLMCKSAAKQNSSEKCQLAYLKSRGIMVESLPAGGKDTWRFIQGTGKFIKTSKIEGKTSHSMDFRVQTDNFDYFIMAKVTTTQGGGQNHQRTEMLDIISDMKLFYEKNPNSNKIFVLLLDGDSYEKDGILPFLEKAKDEKRILIKNSDTFYAN